jgi:hypothetical protein
MAVGYALQNVLEVGIGFAVVEPGGRDQRADDGPAVGAAIRTGEQMVLAAEGLRPDRPLDCVGIELDPAVIQEAAEVVPPDQGIADRIGLRGATRCSSASSQSFKKSTRGRASSPRTMRRNLADRLRIRSSTA